VIIILVYIKGGKMHPVLERREFPRYSCENTDAILFIADKKYKVKVKDICLNAINIIKSSPPKNFFLKSNLKINDLNLPVKLINSRNNNYIFSFILNHKLESKLALYIKKLSPNTDRRSKNTERRKDDRSYKTRRVIYPSLLKCVRYGRIKNIMQNNNYFYMRQVEGGAKNKIIIEGKEYLNFGSNNYLGLSYHPEVIEAAKKALEKYGVGTCGARLLNGTLDLHNELEHKLAEFKGGESCLVYSAGYTANVGVISALAQKDDHIILDKKSHASLIDGCMLSKSSIDFFEHNNIQSLEKKLKKLGIDTPKFIITDGVFSMDGDIAKLDEIYNIAIKYNAAIMVDDAHGTGVIGKTGKGVIEHFNLQKKIPIIIGTLSKALGCMGGFVVAQKDIIHYLKHMSRSSIFNASLPATISASALKSIEIIKKDKSLLQNLWDNTNFVKNNLKNSGFNIGATETPIIPIIIGDDIITNKFTKYLHKKGIFVNPVLYPAVKKKESRLRITIMATHTKADLEYLLDNLIKYGNKLKVV
jgi:8-amino-7-oxononanoate synthase